MCRAAAKHCLALVLIVEGAVRAQAGGRCESSFTQPVIFLLSNRRRSSVLTARVCLPHTCNRYLELIQQE